MDGILPVKSEMENYATPQRQRKMQEKVKMLPLENFLLAPVVRKKKISHPLRRVEPTRVKPNKLGAACNPVLPDDRLS